MERFKNKFNSNSNRMNSFDYSENGYYFVTICTKQRENKFGEIKDGIMMINGLGKLVYDEILNIPKYRENVVLDEFIIMPNHIHLILFLNNGKNISVCRDVLSKHLYTDAREFYSVISPRKGTLGNIIKLFKGYCTKRINKNLKTFFSWQSNYYDRIIRDEKELEKIRKYIIENPLKREWDKNNIN